MSVVKTLEIMAESDVSWEAAAQDAVKEAAKTVKNIKSVWIEGHKGIVENDKIVKYRVNAKISFVVE